jgi:ATP adenylyltransferase
MTDKSESIRAEHARPLWAPWRIEYIKKQDEDRCFLCDNIVDDGPEKDLLIARGETAYLIMNGFPYNSGHVLIAPNRHVADLCDLTADERAEIMELTAKMKRIMDNVMQPQGFNFGFNLGAAAGAGVRDHVHGHLVPRWIGDTNFMPVIGNVRVVPQALAETAKLFRDAWEKIA